MTRLLKSPFINRNLLLLMAFAAAIAPQALKAADALCPLGNATRHGTYMLVGSGTIVGVGATVTLSEVTFDGSGIITAHSTASVNGVIYEDIQVTGTYVINPDCTGSSTSNGNHYSTVGSPDGKKYFFVQTDAGTVNSGTAERISKN